MSHTTTAAAATWWAPMLAGFGSGSADTSNITAYPQNRLHRGGYFISMFDTTALPYNKQYNGCSNTLCYTQSKGTFIYQPHTAYGMVGRSSAGYLAQRRRL